MQILCLSFYLRRIYDYRWIVGFLVFLLSFNNIVYAQWPKSQIKTLQQGTTLDSIYVQQAKVGGLFLEVKSYFEEYSLMKPASTTQLYFQGLNKQGELMVRYVFIHALFDFHMETILTYPNKGKQELWLDQSRRAPLFVLLNLYYKENVLEVDLL